MFDNFKGIASLAGIMKDLPRLKAKMEEVKEHLADVTVEAETGGGAVRVTADGQMRIVSIRIDQAMLAGLVDAADARDRLMAEDLIVGAVNAALVKAKEAAEAKMREVAEEMGLPLPSGGLEGLLS